MVAVAPPESRISRSFSPGESLFFSDEPSDREGCGIAQNWTSYCSNNPVRYVDPTGFEGEGRHHYDIQVTILRRSSSHRSRKEPGFRGNDQIVITADSGRVVLGVWGGVQTVSNHEDYPKSNTLKSNQSFRLRRVEGKKGPYFEIAEAITEGGDKLDEHGHFPSGEGAPITLHTDRSIISDSDRTDPWDMQSGGCIMVPTEVMEEMQKILQSEGVRINDTVEAEIHEND